MRTNPEYNAFKHRIRELETIIVNSKARVEERLDMLDKRHLNFSEKERASIDGLSLVMRMSELEWVLEGMGGVV